MRSQSILKGFACLSALIFVSMASEGALLEISGVAALNLAGPSITQNTLGVDVSKKLSFGFGGLAALPVFPGFDLEGGFLILPHKYSTGSGSLETTTTIQTLHFPVILRVNFLPLITLGLGGYFALGTGNVSTQQGSAAATERSFEQSGLSSSDFGLALAVGTDYSLLPALSLTAGLRYYIGLKNVDNVATQTFNYRGFLFLAGLKFGV